MTNGEEKGEVAAENKEGGPAENDETEIKDNGTVIENKEGQAKQEEMVINAEERNKEKVERIVPRQVMMRRKL